MTEGNGLDLVAAGDVGSLLRRLGLRGWDPASASEQGLIHREKIAGWWLYAENEGVMDQAQSSFASEAERIIQDWFVANPMIVARSAAKSNNMSIGSGAADALMRSLIEVGRFGRLPVFNQSFIPYFAVHAVERQAQVEVTMAEVAHLLARTGLAQAKDLTSPDPAPAIDVWRRLVLAHADYLGWGSLEADSLQAWASL